MRCPHADVRLRLAAVLLGALNAVILRRHVWFGQKDAPSALLDAAFGLLDVASALSDAAFGRGDAAFAPTDLAFGAADVSISGQCVAIQRSERSFAPIFAAIGPPAAPSALKSLPIAGQSMAI